MKNFTNNFKQFTSRLSARWLIMALMMLVGTSSAYAVDYYLRGSFNGWLDGGMQDAYKFAGGSGTVSVDLNANTTYNFKIATSNWSEEYSNEGTMTRDNCTNWTTSKTGDCKITTDVQGQYKFTFSADKKISVQYPPLCSSCCGSDIFRVAGSSNLCGSNWDGNDDNNIMECSDDIFSKSYNITGNTSYTFKIVKNNSDWINTINSSASITNKIALKTTGDNNDVTLSENPSSNGKLTIYYDPNKGIYATFEKSCNTADFSVNTLSDLAVDCTATASITGDNVTVTWSSSETSVASIDPNTGVITAEAAGETTITATTTEDGGFCGGVEKKATLTVISPSVTVKANDNSLCEGETLTLTATLTNCGTDNSIQWYKGEDLLTGETKDQLTISSVTTTNSGEYKAVVTGGIICSSIESSAVTITVNARPSAPSLSNPESICYGTPFTLPEKDNNKKTITWNVNNRELTNLSVDTHTYTAKIVENGCESTTVDYTITVKEQLAKPVLEITNVKQCGSNYTAGKIVISNHDPNNTYILKKDGNPINKAYNDGYSVSENEKGTYTVEVSKDGACGATSDDVTIEVINNTPTVTPFEITKQANVCMGNPVTLSYDGTAQSGTISYAWYEADSEVVIGTESTLTIQQAKNASYKLVVTVTSNDCPASDKATTTVEPKAVPSAPTFDEYEMDACVNQQFTLPKPNNLKYEEEPLWTVEGLATTASQTISEVGEYTYTAYKNDGCPSQGTPFTVRVNPLPTISISGNEKAVLYEDVMLAATATDGATVKWYEGGVEKATGATYVVTSETATSKAVTAKAFLNGCESATTKTVKFSAEDCSDRENTTTTRKTKITCSIPSGWKQISCYTYDSNKREYSGGWPGTVMTSDGNNYSIVIDVDDNMKDLYVIFNNNNNGEQTKDPSPITGGFSYTAGNVGKGQTPTFTKGTAYNESTTTTTPAEITAPAVKMVSAEYDEVNDKIVAKGAVYKTGCGTTFWGFQYSRNGQTWGTTDEYFIRPSTGNSLSVPGEFDYSFAIPNAGGGDIYYIRAYALNNYNGSYALSNAVYSATSLPVEIPSKTIESATISLVDSEGNSLVDSEGKPLDVTEVCPQSTVYLKVAYVGGDFTDFVAEEDFPGTDLELVNHDKVNNYAIFSFTATAAGTANITISNNSGSTVTPANGVSITLKDVQVATPPTIYLEKNTICDDQTTNVVVNSPIIGFIYSLKNGSVGDPVTCESEDLKFSVSKEGSYTVQVQETVCGTTAISAPVDLRVITRDVKITLTTDVNEISPWQPLTLTVKAPSGYDYDLQGLYGTVYTKSGDVYTIKFPRPASWGVGNSASKNEPETKTFTAGIKAGEEPSCSTTTKEIQLVDTEEECLAVGN